MEGPNLKETSSQWKSVICGQAISNYPHDNLTTGMKRVGDPICDQFCFDLYVLLPLFPSSFFVSSFISPRLCFVQIRLFL